MNISTRILILVLPLLLASPAHTAEVEAPALPDKENFHLFLLAGQSNMAGRGEISDADAVIHSRVLMLAKDSSWQYAVDPLHYDKPIAGAGLGKSFAIELANRDPNITVGLVPAACGGSSITFWEPGAYFDKTDSHPYDDAIARTRRAMRDGTLRGILWHQGESDGHPEKSDLYEDRLLALIERFRKDLDAPGIPFIIGQLGKFEGKPWNQARSQVNQAHIKVAASVPYAAFVSSWGLTSKQDNTHFDTRSLHEFGRRYAIRYLQVLNEGHQPEFH